MTKPLLRHLHPLLALLGLWLAAGAPLAAQAAAGSIEGRVTNPATGTIVERARITVEGWESMSWVEVLARMRGSFFGLGRSRTDLPGWLDLRLSGYEYNFAIPGFLASQYEDIVNSSFFSNPQYLPFQSALRETLKNDADWVVIWLGANEFRAKYGALAEGETPDPLIDHLISDLRQIIEFVQKQKAGLKIVLANLPDLNAAPVKRASQPDPAKRARVTAATQKANAAVAALAASQGVALADVFAQTERLVTGVTSFFGAVDIINETHPDNHPRFHFTRDGLHPNTASQIELARVMIDTFNAAFGAGVPNITDAEALKFLGLRSDQPFLDWIETFKVSEKRMQDDPDHDGLPNLVELAFGLDPSVRNAGPVTARVEGGRLHIRFIPETKFGRLVRIAPQRSQDLRLWNEVADSDIASGPDGSKSVSFPMTGPPEFFRVNVSLIAPD